MPQPSSSRFPTDGGFLDSLDKYLSGPMFRLQLGIVLEAVFSIPGCFNGMPAFHVVSPSLIACSVGGRCSDSSRLARVALVLFSLALLFVWPLVHLKPENVRFAKVLYQPAAMIVSPAIGLGLAHWLTVETSARSAASCEWHSNPRLCRSPSVP